MRICLLTRFFNRRNAGIGQYSQKLLAEMLVRGHEVDPICTTHQGKIGYLLYTGMEIRFRRPSDVDIYHALTPLESIYLRKDKTVTTFHDLIPWLHRGEETWYFKGAFGRFRRWFGSWWFKRACKKAAKSERIICNSEQTKREIMEHLGVLEKKIRITRMGVSKDLKPKPKKHDGYKIGTLSYLDPRKRVDILIRAFKSGDLGDAELLIAGVGQDKQRLEVIADGDSRIRFLDFVPEKKKADFYNSLDVFVFPTHLEGYGLPLVEAMACGIPVVSLQDALIPADVKTRTHIVREAFLSGLLGNRNFNCDIRANLRFAKEHDWKKLADQTEAVYEEVAE
ncbi:MAG: glycosyltransferase family 4 protein [Desulfobacterales bacterium]|nr:glycosyltransferase family 4 protein [Desulfobacterales bacterium]